jgi:hypothetical protein
MVQILFAVLLSNLYALKLCHRDFQHIMKSTVIPHSKVNVYENGSILYVHARPKLFLFV